MISIQCDRSLISTCLFLKQQIKIMETPTGNESLLDIFRDFEEKTSFSEEKVKEWVNSLVQHMTDDTFMNLCIYQTIKEYIENAKWPNPGVNYFPLLTYKSNGDKTPADYLNVKKIPKRSSYLELPFCFENMMKNLEDKKEFISELTFSSGGLSDSNLKFYKLGNEFRLSISCKKIEEDKGIL